ncbi:hypothetical protein DPV78_008275 [Talaromyces pinophilus]|nr:hypothetical protein DPV78_008275 [Talaromyces pinophilus]
MQRFCVWCASHEFKDGLADGYDGGVAALDVLDYMILTIPSSNLPDKMTSGQRVSVSEKKRDETHSTTSFTFGRAYAPSASIRSQSSPATTVPSTLSSYPSAVVRVPDFGSCLVVSNHKIPRCRFVLFSLHVNNLKDPIFQGRERDKTDRLVSEQEA